MTNLPDFYLHFAGDILEALLAANFLFVSDLVGKPKDRFTDDAAHFNESCRVPFWYFGIGFGSENWSENNIKKKKCKPLLNWFGNKTFKHWD